LTPEQVAEIQKVANQIIKEAMQTKKEVLSRDEAEKKYGFRLYQGGAVPGKELRVISINDFDHEACGGTHLNNTKDVEEIFIFNTKKIQDGIIRLEFVAGKDLIEKTKKELENQKLKLQEAYKNKKAKLAETKLKIQKIKEKIKPLYGLNYVNTNDMKELEVIGKESFKRNPNNYSILVGNGIVFGIGKDKIVEKLVKEIARLMGGSAGGSGNEYKGGGPLKVKSKEIYNKLKKQYKL